MKKLLFFFCLLVSSQGLFAYGFSYGIKGGWNYTNIKANNLSTSARQGIHAGLYANLKLPLIAIQPELLY